MFNCLALLILLLVPSMAFAMPPALIAIGTFVGASAASALTVGLTVVQVGLSIGMSIYGAAQQRRAERQAKADYNAKLQDRTITNVSTESPYRYVYGRAKVGSSIVAIFTSGDRDQYKHLVCVHAAHECDGIEEIYIAGKPLGALTIDGDVTQGDYFGGRTELANVNTTGSTYTLPTNYVGGSVNVYAPSGNDGGGVLPISFTASGLVISFSNPANAQINITYNYAAGAPTVRARVHLGGPSDAADISLINECGGKWTTNSVLRGFCYTVVRINLNQPEFQSGIPSVEVLMRGKKLYDPRTALTSWSSNPALAIYDYLRSELCGVPASDIPTAQVITAANVCDGAWTFGAAVGPRYTIAGTVSSDDPQAGVLEKMAQSMAGGIVSTTWEIFAGSYVAPTLQLVQADIVGAIAVTPGAADANVYNGVRGKYIGPDSQYIVNDFPSYQSATYLASDGRELWTNLDFSFTDNVQRVYNLARIYTADQRNGYTVKATFSLKAWSVRIGDRIWLNSALFGWNDKVFRVTDRSYSPSSMIELTLKEDASVIWDAADAVSVDVTPNTNLPNPFYAAPLSLIKCSSGTDALLIQQDGSIVSRIRVTWPPSFQANTSIVVEWQPVGGAAWQQTTVAGDQIQAFIAPVDDLQFYTVRAKVVKLTLGNVQSNYVYATNQVIGKSAPPADIVWFLIEGSTLTWSPVADLDLAGYRIRFHYGTNRSWGDANPMHQGLLTVNPYTVDRFPQGPITIMIKAVDTSGNESGTAAFILTQLGNVIVNNVVQTWDFKALSYPGTFTGCTLISGSLRANGSSLVFGNYESDFYKTGDGNPFYVDNYALMVYETSVITPTAAAIGSMLTFNAGITGAAIFIEYRISGNNRMFSATGTDPFYGDNVASFYGQPDVYQAWPGQVVAKNQQYQFRITVGQSAMQGVIDACNAVVDLPDLLQDSNDVLVGSAGTRLPLTAHFTVIENVQITLQSDGGTAVLVHIVDKNATLGPLIRCLNSAGAQVTGKVDAVIQGY